MTSRRIFILFLSLGLFWGCAHVISKETRSVVDHDIAFSELRTDPAAYRGKTVLFGGVIVRSLIEKEGTLLELYQTRVNREGKPVDLDRSEGRFLAFYEGFLDNEIYRNGRKVTVAGVVKGEETMKLGEIDYRYPYLIVKELHLWEEEKPYAVEPYPWGSWYPWGPWYDPYWYWRPHYRYRHP
jgi:outer membrane lipoprotein